MPDYQQGKIYKIWSPSCTEVYYGSTCKKLSVRMAGHKYDHLHQSNSKRCSSGKIVRYDDAIIELI